MRVVLRRMKGLGFTLVAALAAGSCYDFHLEGPEDASPVPTPRLVSVTIEYRQPNGCISSSRCDDPVVFFGSWMQIGAEFALRRDPGNFTWRGVATGVPVNFPPRDQPYLVRVYDPFLRDSPTSGLTGERLRIGGEFLTRFDRPGGPEESALVYIDENGIGHNVF
jgi:hypothetical protein